MKKIDISSPKHPNTFTIVDNEDYEYLNQWKWTTYYQKKTGYKTAVRRKRLAKKKHIIIKMPRFIMNAPAGMEVDHINGNPLDNRRCNLRVCTHQENIMNQKPQNRKKTSVYKGVYRCNDMKPPQKWEAHIKYKQKQIRLGRFNTEKEAAKQYNCAARIIFGQFAYENIIE